MTVQNRLDWFTKLKEVQSHSMGNSFELLAELAMGQSEYERVKAATSRYLQASLGKVEGISSEADLMALVDMHVDELANRTPNGILMPKQELEEEFNDLHRAVATYVRGLGIDHLIFGVSCPIIVRLVTGASDTSTDERPFASTKIHLDSWNDDPGDEVVVSIPMLGDISRTTVEYFQPPLDLESEMLRAMTSYDEGLELMGERGPTPLQQRPGYAYFMDTIVPHRTVKHGGGIRVTTEFRIRRRTTEAERLAVEEACDSGRLAVFLNTALWHSLGTTKRMSFSDTYADAKRGIYSQRAWNEPVYTLVDV